MDKNTHYRLYVLTKQRSALSELLTVKGLFFCGTAKKKVPGKPETLC